MDTHIETHSKPPQVASNPAAGKNPMPDKADDKNGATTMILGLVLDELRDLRRGMNRLEDKVGDLYSQVGELHGKIGETKAELVGKIAETNEKIANDKLQIISVVIATAAVMFAALRYFGVG